MTLLSSARLLIVASAVLAAVVEAYLATAYSPEVLWLGLAGFLLTLIAGRRLRAVALPLTMALLYLAPAALLAARGYRGYGLDVIWILPLLGLICSERTRTWSLPGEWQWPLVTWASIVAVAWPIVFLREANFALWIMPLARVSNASVGFGPSEVNQNVAYFAVTHLTGLLWLDGMFRWYRNDAARFRRHVLNMMAVAATLAALVAIVQGFFDLGFLNDGFWEYMIRASGTLGDPNKLGAVAGLWTVGAIVLARGMTQPWSTAITVLAVALGPAAAWLSGSRTGLAAVCTSLAIAAFETLRWSRLDARRLAGGAAAIAVLAAALLFALQNASTHTIVQRGTLGYLPFFGDRGIAASANELLWDRFGYGPAAIQMIREHAVEGVGVGMFHTLYYDFGEAVGRILRAPDNAQAWWRHNLAELGMVGFLPLLWWCVVFGRGLFKGDGSGDRLSTGMLRGILIGFFVASLFGVPSQSAAITMTFWVLVFWFCLESQIPMAAGRQWAPKLQGAAIALVAIHAGMTTLHAIGDLRPQNRAQRFDWYYRYGYCHGASCVGADGDDVEPDPGENPIGRRWTMKDSLAVIKVRGKVLKFEAWVDHPDSDVRPVHTQVWADGALVYEGGLRRRPAFVDIPATPGRTHMVIETSIDRTFRPSDSGNSRDRRELGLSIRDWVWE
jgi:hypothetical protein